MNNNSLFSFLGQPAQSICSLIYYSHRNEKVGIIHINCDLKWKIKIRWDPFNKGDFTHMHFSFRLHNASTKSQNTKYCVNGLLRHLSDRQLICAMLISLVLIAVLLMLIFKHKYHFRHYFKTVLNNYLKSAKDCRHL